MDKKGEKKMTKVVIKTTNDLYTVEVDKHQEEVLENLQHTLSSNKFILVGAEYLVPVNTIVEVRVIDNIKHEVTVEEETTEHDIDIEE